jgi:hypothetical protein
MVTIVTVIIRPFFGSKNSVKSFDEFEKQKKIVRNMKKLTESNQKVKNN